MIFRNKKSASSKKKLSIDSLMEKAVGRAEKRYEFEHPANSRTKVFFGIFDPSGFHFSEQNQ